MDVNPSLAGAIIRMLNRTAEQFFFAIDPDPLTTMVVVVGGIVAVFVVPTVALVLIVKMLMGRGSAKTPKATAEEARLMQEIYQGLTKMDNRMEALETIIMEKERAVPLPRRGDDTKGAR